MKALVLGNTARSRVSSILTQEGFDVLEYQGPIRSLADYGLTVSFGYRHIFARETLATAHGPVLNLHISHLPFNRGAHPIFWACFNREPTGVTIHQIDECIDTGPIFAQEKIPVAEDEWTFRQAHVFLKVAVEDLFEESIPAIMNRSINPKVQDQRLPRKKKKDLPQGFRGWDSIIGPEVDRLRSMHPPKKN